MTIPKSVSLVGSEGAVRDLIAKMRASSVAGWSVREQATLGSCSGEFVLFDHVAASGLAATLVLWRADDKEGLLRFSGVRVVSREDGKPLTLEDHNQSVEEWKRSLVAPCLTLQDEVHLSIEEENPGPKTWLPDECVRELEAFSRHQRTGIPHWADDRRWREFVCLAHLSRRGMPAWVLESWLREQGWSDDRVDTLGELYSEGLRLLEHYDEKLRGA